MKLRHLPALVLLPLLALQAVAKPLDHPIIWVTTDQREAVREKIEQHTWAADFYALLKEKVDPHVQGMKEDPSRVASMARDIGATIQDHDVPLRLAREAAILYFITEDEAYAQVSADILAAYATTLAPLTPKTTHLTAGTATDDAHFVDSRTGFPAIAIAYDLTHPFLIKPGTTVFDPRTNERRPFDNAEAQRMMRNIAGSILAEHSGPDQHGRVVSNHPILTAPGALYAVLCVEDERERNRLFNVFWQKGTRAQASFKNTILPLYTKQGLWPEPISYSFMPPVSMIVNIVDRVMPRAGALRAGRDMTEGSFLYPNLLYPDGTWARYGDSKRHSGGANDLFRNILDMAERNGMKELSLDAARTLKGLTDQSGGQKIRIDKSPYDATYALDLFWGRDLSEIDTEFEQRPTVLVDHAGIALQRNNVAENNRDFGLAGHIGGAHYVHSHLTGIGMELYGAGDSLIPSAGLPKSVAERRIPLHEHYFRLYAGANTVIVNGTSHGLQEGSWKGNAHVWQDTARNVAAEPTHLEAPRSEHFSFATQRLDDSVNKARQERTLGLVRTSPTSGYYVDVFRSRSLGKNHFHDYILHGLGDETSLATQAGESLTLSPTDRYDNDINDAVKSPGWRFFESERASEGTEDGVHAAFNLLEVGRSMQVFVPGGVQREYTHALAPATREVHNGYDEKPTQILAIRQHGEAWERPFVAILEPSTTLEGSVESVTQIARDGEVVGATVVSNVDGTIITDHVLCLDSDNGSFRWPEQELSFRGRYAVVREITAGEKTRTQVYIGSGLDLEWKGHSVKADADGIAFEEL